MKTNHADLLQKETTALKRDKELTVNQLNETNAS
jgi:hypothetical protein